MLFATITFILFLVAIYITRLDDWNYRYLILLLWLLPFLCYFIIIIITNKQVKHQIVRRVASIFSILLTLAIIPYYFLIVFETIFIEMDHPIKNIKYYHDYVHSEYLLNVFPSDVPNDVEHVQLIESPGLLQASDILALYYIDPQLNIEEFDYQYSEKAEWIGYKKDYSEKKGLLSSLSSLIPIEHVDEDNFKIYLIDGSCDNSGYCNHGQFLLVAVNEETKEVLYKSESW